MRRAAIVLGVAIVAAAVAAFTLLGGWGRDGAHEALGDLHLGPDPPFRIVLSGPLWRDRSLHGGDGAQDFAQVAADEPLYAAIRGTGRARVAEVELLVDGRRQRVVTPRCPRGRCPLSL